MESADPDNVFARIAIAEFDAGDGGEKFKTHRLETHADDLFTASQAATVILTVHVTLEGVGEGPTFLGDLYLYLTDGTTLVTLMNRPGRDAGNPDRYDDEFGFSVTFNDAAAVDVHVYRPSVTGGPEFPLTSMLEGMFQPDGRIENPLLVTTASPRTGALSDFLGSSAEREFTLFAADLAGGAQHQITGWSLNVETSVIPEPRSTLLPLLLLAAGLLIRHRISGRGRSV